MQVAEMAKICAEYFAVIIYDRESAEGHHLTDTVVQLHTSFKLTGQMVQNYYYCNFIRTLQDHFVSFKSKICIWYGLLDFFAWM